MWVGVGGGGGIILKDLTLGPFNYVEQKGYVKILIGCVWGNVGRGKKGRLP